MNSMFWCKYCQDYVPRANFGKHMKQHNQIMNTDAVEHPQYSGSVREGSDDYFICVLHQKKTPCPVKNCFCNPFGMIKKSYMLSSAREGFFPSTDRNTGLIVKHKINMETKTITIMGVMIRLRI